MSIMKNIINLLATTALLAAGAQLVTTTESFAQNRVRAGIKGGLNASSLFYDAQGVNNKRERIGFHGGVFAQVPAGDFFAVQPELLYTTKGSSAEYNLLGINGRNTFRLNYVELPVLATFKLGQAVELQAGPYVSYLLKADLSANGDVTGTTTFNRDNFNKIDYGVAGGLNLFVGKALLGLRYEQGLQRVASSGVARTLLGNAKNGVGMISVGFSLN